MWLYCFFCQSFFCQRHILPCETAAQQQHNSKQQQNSTAVSFLRLHRRKQQPCTTAAYSSPGTCNQRQQAQHVEVPDLPECLCLLQVSQGGGPCHGAHGPRHRGIHMVCCGASNLWTHDGRRVPRCQIWQQRAGAGLLMAGERERLQ